MPLLATALCSIILSLAPQATASDAPAATAQNQATATQAEVIERDIWLDREPDDLMQLIDAIHNGNARGTRAPVDASIVARSDGRDARPTYGIRLRGPTAAVDQIYAWVFKTLGNQDAFRDAERKRLEASTVSIDFPGGTVEEFVTSVLGTFELVPPVYANDDIRALRMTAVKTHQMSIAAALDLLVRVPPTDAYGQPVRLRVSGTGNEVPGAPRYSGRQSASSAEEALIDQRSRVIVIERDPRANTAAEPARRAAIFLPPSRSSDAAIDELLDAISVAVHLEKRSPTFVAKMHKPSRMLIVRGTEDELGLVAQVVRGFEPNVRIELPTFSATEAPTRPTSGAPAGR